MFLTLRRIIKTGFINFWRNGFVSISSIVVMVTMLFIMGSLIFTNALLQSALELMRDKVDINAYFVLDAPEESILKVKEALEQLPETERVIYTSRDEAYERYKERHADDEIDLQALEELGDNPLQASLSIKAKDPSYYPRIAEFLETDATTLSTEGTSIVAKVNYRDNKAVIEKLQQVIHGMEVFSIFVSSILFIVSIVVVYNTIRMAIYISREEIAVMRLVGASDLYIRGPFVFEGVMYGLISAIITLTLFYPITLYIGPATQDFFGNINLFTYYTTHFGSIFLTIVLVGVFAGGVSSFLAVKKYLRG